MKSGKRHITEQVELPIQVVIRTLGEKEAYKYLVILEADTIKQQEMKEKIKKEERKLKKEEIKFKKKPENCSRQNSIAWTLSKG